MHVILLCSVGCYSLDKLVSISILSKFLSKLLTTPNLIPSYYDKNVFLKRKNCIYLNACPFYFPAGTGRKLNVHKAFRRRRSVKVNKSVSIAKSGQRYDKTRNNLLLHVPNHALKDMYVLNYGIINNMSSLYHSSIEVLVDLFNSVITLHVFYKQLHFLLQDQVTYSRMNFQSESLKHKLILSINFVRTKRLKLVKNKSKLRKF